MPIVSVLMSVFKEPIDWINSSIESIICQSLDDFEFFIVNDNPTNAELDSFLDFWSKKDPRIVILKNSENLGLTKSLNLALKLSQGQYIARMDADDISKSDRFEIQVDFLEQNPDYVLVGSNMELFGDQDGTRIYPMDNDSIKLQLIINNPISHPSIVVRADVIRNHQLSYDESMKYAQDLSLFMKLAEYGKFFNIQKNLIRYRKSSNQISSAKVLAQTEFSLKIRRRYFEYDFDRSIIENRFKLHVFKQLGGYLFSKPTSIQDFFVVFKYSFYPFCFKIVFNILRKIY